VVQRQRFRRLQEGNDPVKLTDVTGNVDGVRWVVETAMKLTCSQGLDIVDATEGILEAIKAVVEAEDE
jgi:hypothetical protein